MSRTGSALRAASAPSIEYTASAEEAPAGGATAEAAASASAASTAEALGSGGATARKSSGGEGGGVMPTEEGDGCVRGTSRCILSFRGPGALGVVVLHGGEGGGEAGVTPNQRALLLVVVVVVVVVVVMHLLPPSSMTKTGVSGRPLGSVAMSRGVTLDASRAMDSKEEMPKAGT